MSSGASGDDAFQATRWAQATAAASAMADDGGALARRHLLKLCLQYWPPVYAYLRQRGDPREAALALTAAFFRDLVEHDRLPTPDRRFSQYLLGELQHFLARTGPVE